MALGPGSSCASGSEAVDFADRLAFTKVVGWVIGSAVQVSTPVIAMREFGV